MAEALTKERVEEFLRGHEGWEFDGERNMLVRTFTFPNFAAAIAAANKVGDIAEELNHHPDMHVSWGKLVVKTQTHDMGGAVTKKDIDIAAKIDTILQS
jgi:4a-hydroxytetrahydrobiopterin dehydratase